MRYILQIIAVNQYTGYNINTFTYNYNENIQETILLPTNTNNRNLIIKIIKNITKV
mgnify:CR=1 FL=1